MELPRCEWKKTIYLRSFNRLVSFLHCQANSASRRRRSSAIHCSACAAERLKSSPAFTVLRESS